MENHQKMCPSWKDTKFYELGIHYKQKFKKLEKSNLFVVENHQKMCPSWKDTKFYELGLIFII